MTKNHQKTPPFGLQFLLVLMVFLCFSNSYGFNEKDPDLSLFNHDRYVLEPYLEIMEDPSNKISIDDILADEGNAGFQENERAHINYSFTTSTIWLRLDIDYPVHSSNKLAYRSWYLEIDRAYLDTCELYIVDENNQYQKLKADISMPQEARDINSPTSVFPINLALGDRKKIYVKIETLNALYFQVNLWRPEAFLQHATLQQLSYGFFYGGMAIIIIYNLFLYVSTRDRNYIFYISYMASITLLEFIELGHGLHVTGVLQDYLHKKHIPSIGWFTWASVLLFTMTYIETKKNHPFFHFIIQRMLIILTFNILIDPFVSYQTSVFSLVFFSSLCLILIPSVSLYSWLKGNPNGEYFTYAIFASITGITLYCLVTMDIVPSSKAIISLFSLGIMAEALLFSFAIGNRINRARNEAMKAKQDTLDSFSRYQSLFENAEEGMYQTDLKGSLLRSNDALARILGLDNAKHLLASPQLMGDYFFSTNKMDLNHLLEAENQRSEFCFTNQQNKLKWISHSANLVRDANQNPVALEGIVIDITDRKEREAAQQASLEETYRKELAAKESTDTTNFLANMSFRIRCSLNGILGYAEVQTLGEVDNKDKRTSAIQGLQLSNQLLSLINKILDYSKLEANKLDTEELEIELLTAIDNALSQSRKKGCDIACDYHYPLPVTAISDPTRLNQCITEIIEFVFENSANSSDLTKMEKQKVHASILFDKSMSTLNIALRFKSAQQQLTSNDSLFNNFKKKNAWKILSSQDTGLGIALTDKLAKLLGGSLKIESKTNGNTEIHLVVPTKLTETTEFCDNQAAHKQYLSRLQDRKQKNAQLEGKVLVAEDNIVNQKLIGKLLTKMGLEATIVENGEEAVNHASKFDYDVILMDLNMPVMDGFEATKTLLDNKYQAPIYALTAENDPTILQNCIDAGFAGHLEKPIKRDQLMSTLKPHLEQKTDKNGDTNE